MALDYESYIGNKQKIIYNLGFSFGVILYLAKYGMLGGFCSGSEIGLFDGVRSSLASLR